MCPSLSLLVRHPDMQHLVHTVMLDFPRVRIVTYQIVILIIP